MARCIEEAGFGFMFAPAHHGATRYVVPVRKDLAVRTIFNFLGPLTNPAGATRQLIGVSDAGMLDTMAAALSRLGATRALVVSSADGLDELSTSAPTQVVEVNFERIERYTVSPADCGLPEAPADAIPGAGPEENAATTRAIFAGEAGPARDIAVLNAGAAIYAAGAADSIPAGVTAAQEAIDSGAAQRTLERLRGAQPRRMNVLERIVDATRSDLRRRRKEIPIGDLERQLAARTDDRPFSEALTQPGVSVIAEHKRASPSAGGIRPGSSVTDIVEAYERGGAAALSILTEPHHFGGSLADLAGGARRLAAADPAQGLHRRPVPGVRDRGGRGRRAAAHRRGRRPRRTSRSCYREARAIDLDVLVEVHSDEELECALEVIDADVIGINNRDLGDFSVDTDRTYELLSDVPAGKTVVSESGFHSRDQLDELERVGVDAVLVGESLMRSPDPEAALRALTGQDFEAGLDTP